MSARCQNPRPTRRTFNAGYGAKAWCPGCKAWMPSAQVPWGRETRNALGEITASYAPIAH